MSINNLICPWHIKSAVKTIGSLKNRIDLFIVVLDARAPNATNFSSLLENDFCRNNGTKILNVFSKPDLSDLKLKNSFDLKNSKSRKIILSLIKKILEVDKYKKENYCPYLQVMVVGYPNTGKSSLINLLKGKKVAISENMPGKTKKVSKFPIGDNIWVYDTPGIFFPKKTQNVLFNHLFLIGSVPYIVRNYSHILEWAYIYLMKYYHSFLEELIGINISGNYLNFLNILAQKYKFISPEGNLDVKRSEEKFLNIIRSGKIKLNWDKDV